MFKNRTVQVALSLGLIGLFLDTSAFASLAPMGSATSVFSVGALVQETPTARISAQFSRPDGKPAAGATWYVSGWKSNEDAVKLHGLPDDWETLRGTLDEGGRIDLRFVPPQAYQFIFNVSCEGCGQASWRFTSIKPTEEKLLGKIQLKPECPIVGRIVGPDGKVLSHQFWRIRAREAQVGGFSGRHQAQTFMIVDKGAQSFTVRGLPPGAAEVNVGGAGLRGETRFPVVLKAGETLERDFMIDLVALRGTKITVTCRAKPFRRFRGPQLEHVKVVAADGTAVKPVARVFSYPEFSIEADAPGPFTLSINDPRFEPWEREGIKKGDRIRVDLKGTASLKLDVRDLDGAPETMYSVELAAVGDMNPPVEVAKRGHVPDDGWLRGLVPARYEVTIRSAEGVARVTMLALKPGENHGGKVELAAPVMARGTVTFPSGEPAVGAEVLLLRPAKVGDSARSAIMWGRTNRVPPSYRTRAGMGQCDADGAYAVEVRETGKYIIVAREAGKGWVMGDVTDVAEDGLSLNLVLPYGALLKGLVVLPPHLPVEGWEVYLGRDDYFDSLDRQMSAPRLDSEGAFQCVGVRPGPVDVYVRQASNSLAPDGRGAPRDGFFVGSILLEEGGAHEAQFDFEAASPSMVRPVITSNVPLAGEIFVSLMDRDEAKEAVSSIVIRGAGDAASSSFAPKMVPAGQYDVWVVGDDWAAFHCPPVGIEGGKVLELPLTVKLEERRLLITRGGEPLAGGIVLVRGGALEIQVVPV